MLVNSIVLTGAWGLMMTSLCLLGACAYPAESTVSPEESNPASSPRPPTTDTWSVTDTSAAGPMDAYNPGDTSLPPGDEAGPGDDLAQPPLVDGLSNIRYVRVLTEQSPSWVSWREVQTMGSWSGTDNPPTNLALGATTTASTTEPGSAPDLATDGDSTTSWNAGDFAPASLDLSFSAPVDLTQILLQVNQVPDGPTVHVIQVAASPGAWETVHVFDEHTTGGQWLAYTTEEDGDPEDPPDPPDPPDVPPGSVGKWHRQVLAFSTNTYDGNPFQVVVDGTFTHTTTGETLVLPGYYDGADTWKIGFMPTLVGEWTWSTSSPVPGLSGHTGTTNVVESGHLGFLSRDPQHPDKWRYADGPLVVPVGVFVNAMLEDATEEQFINMADFVQSNHLALLNFRLSENDGAFSDVGGLTMHLGRWQRLEKRMEILTERGLGVDVMLYTDDSGKPSFGPQSPQEQLLIRYTVARLCGFPSVMFNTGIDLHEYRDQSWVNWFGAQITSQDPYGHPVSSRYKGGSGSMVMQGQTYNSVGDRNSAIAGLLAAYAPGDGVPAANNDNFSEDLPGNINGHSPQDIRRAAWKATIAGGVAFHVRHNTLFCPGGITECDRYFHTASLQDELDSEQWLTLVNPFVQEHLGETFATMTPAPELVHPGGGKFALADPGRDRILYFLLGVGDAWDAGDGGAITLQLSSVNGSFEASWFDPRTGTSTPVGSFSGSGDHAIAPPSGEDWLLLLKRL